MKVWDLGNQWNIITAKIIDLIEPCKSVPATCKKFLIYRQSSRATFLFESKKNMLQAFCFKALHLNYKISLIISESIRFSMKEDVLNICSKFTGEHSCPRAKQLYWNHTSACVFSQLLCCIFSQHFFLRTSLEGCFYISLQA